MNPIDVIPHTMRHTALTNFAEASVDAKVLKKFSGHRTTKMALRYTHARDERVDEAVERMENARTKPVQIAEWKRDES